MQHMNKMHNVDHHLPNDCDYCKMKFSTNQELIEHAKLDEMIGTSGPIIVNSVIIESNENKLEIDAKEEYDYHCTICLTKYTYEAELDTHVDKLHRIMSQHQNMSLELTVDLSKEETKQNNVTTESQKLVPKLKEQFECDKCNFKADTSRNIRMHKKNTHDAFQRKQCSLCPKVLESKENFLIHIKKKHGNIKCDKCEFKTTSPLVMKTHDRKQHKIRLKCAKTNLEAKQT